MSLIHGIYDADDELGRGRSNSPSRNRSHADERDSSEGRERCLGFGDVITARRQAAVTRGASAWRARGRRLALDR